VTCMVVYRGKVQRIWGMLCGDLGVGLEHHSGENQNQTIQTPPDSCLGWGGPGANGGTKACRYSASGDSLKLGLKRWLDTMVIGD